MDKRLEILDLHEEARALINECELTGKRTLFERDGRPVAMLVSYDEYMALRETLEMANDAAMRARIDKAEDQARRGEMDEVPGLTRLRVPDSFAAEEAALSAEDRETLRGALAVIDDDPIVGAPLFEPLKGVWSYRAGALRIVYRIVAEARFVLLLGVDHGKR